MRTPSTHPARGQAKLVLEARIERVLMFTGHMIDAPGRQTPRFPRSKASIARVAIKNAVLDQCIPDRKRMLGIASCASGGDILFHEICAEMNIDTLVFLALPDAQFVEQSVAEAGPEWIGRFYAIRRSRPTYVLDAKADKAVLPREGNVWQRTNLWMLQEALLFGANKFALIALWDGQQGDGLGGTSDLVRRARRRKVPVVVLDTKSLFGLDESASTRS